MENSYMRTLCISGLVLISYVPTVYLYFTLNKRIDNLESQIKDLNEIDQIELKK